jgi:hypothetical protein
VKKYKTVGVKVMSFGLEPTEDWEKVEKLSQKILALVMNVENAPTANHAVSALALTIAFLTAMIQTSDESDKTLHEVIAGNKEAIAHVLESIEEGMGSREEAVVELVSSFSKGTTLAPEKGSENWHLSDKPETVH